MNKAIITTLISFVVGTVIVAFSMLKIEISSFYVFVMAIGFIFIILPNALWLIITNKTISKHLDQKPNKTINFLAFYSGSILSVGLSGAIIMMGTGLNEAINTIVYYCVAFSMLSGFATLICAAILSAKRLLDAEGCPRSERAVKGFIYVLAFFYIAIGMFFIAHRLKTFSTTRPHFPY